MTKDSGHHVGSSRQSNSQNPGELRRLDTNSAVELINRKYPTQAAPYETRPYHITSRRPDRQTFPNLIGKPKRARYE